MNHSQRTGASAESDADVAFRAGLEASHRGEQTAMQMLNTAMESYTSRREDKCAALATAAFMITAQVNANYRRFPEHIAALAIVRDPEVRWDSGDEELLALAGLLAGLIFFEPEDPFIERCVERVMTLLELDLDVNTKFAAGRLVIYYTEPRELRALGQRVYSVLHPCMQHPALTPHRLGHWLIYWARIVRYAREPVQAQLAEDQARALAESNHLRDILFWLAFIEVDRSMPERNVEKAGRALAIAERAADPAHLGDLLRLEFLQTKFARMTEQGDRAVFHASRATRYAIELGFPPAMRAIYIVSEAQARLLIDDLATALELLRAAAAMVPAHYADEVRDMIALTEAYQAVMTSRADGRALLASAWAVIRARQSYDVFDGFPEFGAKLCVLALENSIETDFVRRLVEMRNIAAPQNAPETWPWSVSIRALGPFALRRRGEILASESKAQKKPLELLKAIIALGGRGVPKEKLSDLLWPDASAADAATSLDVVILRLRKLLKNPDAIRVENSNVDLDGQHVWLDVWAFDRDVEALQTALHGITDAATVDRIALALLAHYRGPFLGNEELQRWSLSARDRLQNRFRRSLADAGRYWEQQNDWQRAIALYERALEEDNLAEDLYRRLMRGYIARGESADAARVYRRCRAMLSVQLGIPPSADTEALFRSIYDG